jgi:predicted ATPase
LLKTLPDTRARTQRELRLLVTLGGPLQATRTFSAPEVGATYTRARELCQQLGETRQLFPVLNGLRTFHQVRGEFLAARELGEHLLALAQREQDPASLVEAYWALGGTFFHLGEFGAAQAHLEQGLLWYDAQRHHSQVFLYGGMEPGVSGLCFAALVLWQLGYPDQALHKSEAARTLAQERPHPYSLAAAQVFAARLHQLRRESPLTQEWAEAALTLAREHGFPAWVGAGTSLQGWALANQGQRAEGMSQVRQGLATYEATGVGIFRSYHLVLLAEAYEKGGQVEEGLAALAQARTVVDNSGERFYGAELYRLTGELTLARSSVQRLESSVPSPQAEVEREAEACFHKAIDIARKQQAKSLELRATTSLARLWQQQGKHHAARTMLSEIYNWFTEGFDTQDLKDAKALLEEISEYMRTSE